VTREVAFTGGISTANPISDGGVVSLLTVTWQCGVVA
jgi:hypothetical protein